MTLPAVTKYNHCLLPAGPAYADFPVSRWQAILLLVKHRAVMLRWCTDFDRLEESAFWHVIKDSFEPYESLGKRRRAEIRRALQNYDVRPISQSAMISEGYAIHRAAVAEYGSSRPLSEADFKNDILSHDSHTYEYWGVFPKDTATLVGYCINRCVSDTCNYLAEKIIPDHRRTYASYAINYRMNEHYLVDRRVRYIDLGAKRMQHDTNVQDFHIAKMGFRRAYCRLNVRFLPGVKAMLIALQPFRGLFERKSWWQNSVELLYRHDEYNKYGHRPDIIYRYEGSPNDGSDDSQGSLGTLRIETFQPTPRRWSRERSGLGKWLRYLFRYILCRRQWVIHYVYDNDRMVHCSHVMGRGFRLTYVGKDDLFVGPVWTDPDYRGRGIMPAVLRHICATHSSYRYVYGVANHRNRASRRGFEKASFSVAAFGYTTRFLKRYRKLE
jgi:RimJ/RimL family protein N-acetyltransferase